MEKENWTNFTNEETDVQKGKWLAQGQMLSFQ